MSREYLFIAPSEAWAGGKDDIDSLKPRIGTQRTLRPAKPSQQPEPSLAWNQGDLGCEA